MTQRRVAKASEPAAIVESHDDVLLITLNRPAVLNAINSDLSGIVGSAIERLANDPELRTGIITGSGRAFCAGMDLKAYSAGEDVRAPNNPQWGSGGVSRHPIDKPLIAAVNGIALGGGMEIALACDLIIASSEAVFGLPEVKRGLVATGAVFRLPRLIPRRQAMEMILTGDPIDANRALELGLVNRVVPSAQLLDAAFELAQRISANSPLGVQGSKQLVRQSFCEESDRSEEIWERHDRLLSVIGSSGDAREGAKAFAEGRPPVWKGR